MRPESIDPLHIEDLRSELHPSIFVRQESYSMLLLRLPLEVDKTLQMQNYGFIWQEGAFYRYRREGDDFEPLSLQQLYRTLDGVIDRALQLTKQQHERLELLEEELYEQQNLQEFMPRWFAAKKDILRTSRVLALTLEVFQRFLFRLLGEDDSYRIEFEDLSEHLQRAERSSQLGLEKLDSLYSFYITDSNDKMNKTIYALTIISAVFLPLNLIVGFFGMNTTDLFFTEAGGGTFAVLGIIAAVSTGTLYLLYKRKT